MNPELVLEIARRIDLRADSGYAWLAVIPSSEAGENSLADIRDELEVSTGASIRSISTGTAPIHEFIAVIMSNVNDTVLLSGLDEWSEEKWIAFDIQRSSLERRGTIILVLSPVSIGRLSNCAPNIRSFIGGSIFQLAPSGGFLTDADRIQRIHDLEKHFGISSEELLKKAHLNELDPSPVFVEWLVLLGRGDLV